MRGAICGVLSLASVLLAAACSISNCPPIPCNQSSLGPFTYCIEDKNCSVDGVLITSCSIGGGNVCPLWTLGPNQVLVVPFGRIWADAGSRRDLVITYADQGGPDLTLASVVLDGVPTTCERSATQVMCRGVGPTLRELKFQLRGKSTVGGLYLWLRDTSCNYAPCPV